MREQNLSGHVPLPIKLGVSPSCLYLRKGNWKTIFDFFCYSFPHISFNDCLSRFNQGEVRFEDGQVIAKSTEFKQYAKVFYYRELSEEIKVPFKEKIIFENERFLIVDKPHFLPVAPSGDYLHETLIVRLRRDLKLAGLELSHRLDRETAGLVLVTKKKEYRSKYHSLFSERKITKIYHAVSNSLPTSAKFPLIKKSYIVKSEPFFLMEEFFVSNSSRSEESETKIELLERKGENSLYKLTPKTGKKHQLRVHMASIGLPIRNDKFYPELVERKTDDFSKPLQLLAKSLHFNDPFDKENYDFYSNYNLCL